jgi:uncharacterized membrane protein
MVTSYMRSLVAKKVVTITAAAFILLSVTTMAVMTTFATANAESSVRVRQSQSGDDGSSSVRVTQSSGDGSSSVRVTQSGDDGLEVSCEGDVNCDVIGDDTVVATSEDGDSTDSTAVTTTTTDTTNTVNQPDLDDLGDSIERLVDRLLDEVSANLVTWRASILT